MPLPAFRYVRSANPDTEAVQQNVRDAFRGIFAASILDGQLLEDVTLTTSFADIAHGLGRTPRGCIPARLSDLATIAEDVPGNPDPSALIRLKASVAVTVSLWVF
jgi:hypothetical protein